MSTLDLTDEPNITIDIEEVIEDSDEQVDPEEPDVPEEPEELEEPEEPGEPVGAALADGGRFTGPGAGFRTPFGPRAGQPHGRRS